ncbi:MAG: hypothetical protein L0H73_05660 [Nitrococcus sp.]|nr:hypothetical protein [Nitrococcus sp.]
MSTTCRTCTTFAAPGLGSDTLFTLFVLPAFYALFVRDHSRSEGHTPAERADGERS